MKVWKISEPRRRREQKLETRLERHQEWRLQAERKELEWKPPRLACLVEILVRVVLKLISFSLACHPMGHLAV